MNFKTFLSTQLNKEQKQAVEHKNGSLLVVAGAGSGKTRVITARITHLIINHMIDPAAIVALTFTNKAAQEMKERIQHFLGDAQQELPFIGTFHSYCLFLLKKNQHLLNTPFFSILDEEDRTKLLGSIIKRNNLQKQITAKSIGYHISHLKNHTINPQTSDFQRDNKLLADIYRTYEHEKQLSKCLDFDDLLLHGLKLFEKHKEFKTEFQGTVKHLLVDEYQDTNIVQHALLKQMAKQGKKITADSVCVVGDEDQSIYSWRGATVANILNFKKDFPQTTVITIEQNYRSVQPILTVANQVITHNTERNPKQLWSEKKGSNRIRALAYLSEYQEAQAIAQFVKIATTKQKRSSIAILYRTHFQSRALEEGLIKCAIPYKIIGGINFYARKEIKDILAYIRLIINPFDRPSLLRILNTPTRGLGPAVHDLIHEQWKDEPFLTFIEMLNRLIELKKITGKKVTTLKKFITIFAELNNTTSPTVTAHTIITRTMYLTYLKDSYEAEEARNRVENIQELLNAIKHFESQRVTTIEQFLDQVALMQEHKTEQDNQQDPVLLMTLHAAKGLEFNTVIIAGLEDGLLPSSRSLQEVSKIEEERRLFYVGITRAKERLLLTRARYRYTYGQMVDQLPSRFLKEVPSTLVDEHDASHSNETQHRLFFADWLGIQIDATPVYTFGVAQTAYAIEKKITIAQRKSSYFSNKKSIKPSKSKSTWKKNQPVKHQTFGIGIIQNIEQKSDTVYLTVRFKTGKKKIAAHFLQAL